MRRTSVSIGLSLLLVWVPNLASAKPLESDTTAYRARAGDNLYTLAQTYLHHFADYRVVQRLNAIRDPLRIPVGKELRIPTALLRFDPYPGSILSVTGDVELNGQPARRRLLIKEGDRLTTGIDAFLSVRLTDGSTIEIPSHSAVRIARLRRILLTNKIDRVFELEAGRVVTQAARRQSPEDRFEIRTPVLTAAVRGTEFRVAQADDRTFSTAEVLKGDVSAIGAGETNVPAGYGVRATPAALSSPVPLLDAPTLAHPGRTQAMPSLSFHADPLPKAVRYRAQVALDGGFLNVVEESEADNPALSLASLPNGNYFIKLTAIDAAGLEGKPRVYAFERYLNGVRATMEMGGKHRFLFRWEDLGSGKRTYQFYLAYAAAPNRPVIDQPGLTDRVFVLTNLPSGSYIWRVMTSTFESGRVHSDWSPEQSFTVGTREASH